MKNNMHVRGQQDEYLYWGNSLNYFDDCFYFMSTVRPRSCAYTNLIDLTQVFSFRLAHLSTQLVHRFHR